MAKRTKAEIDAYVAATVAKQLEDAKNTTEGEGHNSYGHLRDVSQATETKQVATTFTSSATSRSFSSSIQPANDQENEKQGFWSRVREGFSNFGGAVKGFFSKLIGGGDSSHNDDIANARMFKGNEFGIKLDNRIVDSLVDRVKANGNTAMEAVEVKALLDTQSGVNRVVSRQIWVAPDHSIPGQVSYKVYAMGNGGEGYHRSNGTVSSGNSLAVTARGGTVHANGASQDSRNSRWRTEQGDNYSIGVSGALGDRTAILIHTKHTPSKELIGSESAGCFTMCDKSASDFRRVSDALSRHNGGGYDINFSRTRDSSNPLLNSNVRDNKNLSASSARGMDRLEANLGELNAPQQYYASHNISQGNGRNG